MTSQGKISPQDVFTFLEAKAACNDEEAARASTASKHAQSRGFLTEKEKALVGLGWYVHTIWECEIEDGASSLLQILTI